MLHILITRWIAPSDNQSTGITLFNIIFRTQVQQAFSTTPFKSLIASLRCPTASRYGRRPEKHRLSDLSAEKNKGEYPEWCGLGIHFAHNSVPLTSVSSKPHLFIIVIFYSDIPPV